MTSIFQVVSVHGYSVLFAAVFARQIGLPVPANLFLMAAGAIAATGQMKCGSAVALAVVACVLADWVWYEAGRWRGEKVLHFLHSFAPDPEKANRNAKSTFTRWGASILLVAKFLPGLDAVAPPLAGVSGTSRTRFLALEASGAGLWSVSYFGTGYYFSHNINRAATYAARFGTLVLAIAGAAMAFYIIRKVAQLRSVQRSRRRSGCMERDREGIVLTETVRGVDRNILMPALIPAAPPVGIHPPLSFQKSTILPCMAGKRFPDSSDEKEWMDACGD